MNKLCVGLRVVFVFVLLYVCLFSVFFYRKQRNRSSFRIPNIRKQCINTCSINSLCQRLVMFLFVWLSFVSCVCAVWVVDWFRLQCVCCVCVVGACLCVLSVWLYLFV